MRILITGGAGFIGAGVANALKDRHTVWAMDDLHRGNRIPDGVGFQCADIRDPAFFDIAPDDVEVVIHAAAIAGVGTVVQNPYKTLDVNLMGTANLLHRLPESVQHFLYFSTSEVYGPNCYRAKETDATTQGPLSEPRWTYAMSKLAGEYLVAGYCREHDIPFTIIRPFNVYGPGQIGEGAVHWFIKNALANRPIRVHGDGTPIRSWCHLDDCVDAVVRMVDNTKADDQIFNIGNPRATMSTLGLAERIVEMAYSQSPIVFEPIAYPEIDVRVPDVSLAHDLLEWTPKIGLGTGLTRTIEAMRCAS
jgi:nucleoside-diphosphate-sugar epimerase